MEKIKVKLIDGGKMPEYMTSGSACADCYARLVTPYVTVPKGSRVLVNLGFAIELPEGYEAVIRPRSGLSDKIDVVEGTIDWDYRGEVKCRIVNGSGGDFDIKNLDRICQMKIQKAERFEFVQADELSEIKRGEKGFGSTGVN